MKTNFKLSLIMMTMAAALSACNEGHEQPNDSGGGGSVGINLANWKFSGAVYDMPQPSPSATASPSPAPSLVAMGGGANDATDQICISYPGFAGTKILSVLVEKMTSATKLARLRFQIADYDDSVALGQLKVYNFSDYGLLNPAPMQASWLTYVKNTNPSSGAGGIGFAESSGTLKYTSHKNVSTYGLSEAKPMCSAAVVASQHPDDSNLKRLKIDIKCDDLVEYTYNANGIASETKGNIVNDMNYKSVVNCTLKQ